MTTVVYVSNADSRDISVLRLDERSGAATTLQTIGADGLVMPMGLSPDQRFLFVARRSEPFAALTFSIDPRTGTLTRVGEGPLPESMAYIASDRSGRFLFSASYGGNLIAVNPIGADGVVHSAQQELPTGPNAHAIRADASNRFVFATALGAGVVMQFRFDAATGTLVPNVPAAVTVRAGAGPRHLEFHPDGRVVYLLNELDASLDVFALDREAGTLSPVQTLDTLPPGFSGKPWAADLHVTPDGRFLYTSERRSSTLASFAVDAASGLLEPLGHCPAQAQPRGFQITASGRWLIVAGQLSHHVGVHAIDAATGRLTLVHEHAVGRNPNWVETLVLTSP